MGGLFSRRELVNNHLEREIIQSELKQYIDNRLTVNAEQKAAYDALYIKHNLLLEEKHSCQKNVASPTEKSVISNEAIKKFVKNMIEDPKTNIYGFPDMIESAVYTNVLNTILHAAAHMADSSQIKFMGHKITIKIEPDLDC